MKKIFLHKISFFVLISLPPIVAASADRLPAQEIRADASKQTNEPIQIQLAPIQEPTDSIIRNELDPFRGRVRSRLGMKSLDMLSSEVENRTPRISSGAVLGRGNRQLGIDRNAPGSRIKPLPSLSAPSALAAESTEQRSPAQTVPVPSANTIAPSASGSYSPEPVRRPTGYFDRADTMPSMIESPPLIDQENIMRTPEQRWFRDFGGMQENSRENLNRNNPEIGLRGGFGRRPEPISSENQIPSGGGEAVSVGGPGMNQTLQQRQVSESNFRVDPRRQAFENQQAALRTFEQRLEAKLLGDPGVHLLSPVQVSFKNGVATVRGVVPSQAHKVAAGNLLLTDPTIKQVNNLITTVPQDPAQIPAPIEPKD